MGKDQDAVQYGTLVDRGRTKLQWGNPVGKLQSTVLSPEIQINLMGRNKGGLSRKAESGNIHRSLSRNRVPLESPTRARQNRQKPTGLLTGRQARNAGRSTHTKDFK